MPDDLDTPDNDEQPEDNAVMRELRQKAKRADTAEARTTELERELVIHKAGLTTLTDKQLKALAAAHDGDWEPEALKATATELGFGAAPKPDDVDEPRVPAEELAAHQRVADAAGSEPAAPTDLDAAIDAAQTPEELSQILANAGMRLEDQ